MSNTDNQPGVFSFALKSALILGAVDIIYNTVGVLAHQLGKAYLSWVLYLIFAIGGFVFTREYRTKHANGFMNYGKAFNVSFQVIFYAGVIGALYTLLMKYFIFPGEFIQVQKLAEQKMIENNTRLTDEQMETSLKAAHMLTDSPLILLCLSVAGSALMSALISLVLAVFCRKEAAGLPVADNF